MADVETIRWKLREMIAEMVSNRAGHVACIERIDQELADARIALGSLSADATPQIDAPVHPRPVELPTPLHRVQREKHPVLVKLVYRDVCAFLDESGPQSRLAILRQFNIPDLRAGVALHAWARNGQLILRDGLFFSSERQREIA